MRDSSKGSNVAHTGLLSAELTPPQVVSRESALPKATQMLSSLLVPEDPARLDVGSGAFKAAQNDTPLPFGKIELQRIPKR